MSDILYICVRVKLSHDPQFQRACDITAWEGAVVVQGEAEDVGGPGQATTAQYLTDFFTTMLILNLHRGQFALIISRQYFLHGIGISREQFRDIAVTVLPQR